MFLKTRTWVFGIAPCMTEWMLFMGGRADVKHSFHYEFPSELLGAFKINNNIGDKWVYSLGVVITTVGLILSKAHYKQTDYHPGFGPFSQHSRADLEPSLRAVSFYNSEWALPWTLSYRRHCLLAKVSPTFEHLKPATEFSVARKALDSLLVQDQSALFTVKICFGM